MNDTSISGPVLLALRVLLSLSLYAFLGLALLALWGDLKRQGELLALRQPPPLTLRGTQAGLLRFNQPEIILGRDPTCACPLDEATVSARHARLSFHHNQWWLEDLGSTNGTFLNDEIVLTATVVTRGDFIRCGSASLEVVE